MSSIFLDYTPNEKKLLPYIRQGHRPELCMHPEEALRWRKSEWDKMQNSAHYTEKMAITKIREYGRSADEAAGKELQRIYTQKSDSVRNEEQRKTVNSEEKKTYNTSSKSNIGQQHTASTTKPSKNNSNNIWFVLLIISVVLTFLAGGVHGGIVGIICFGFYNYCFGKYNKS